MNFYMHVDFLIDFFLWIFGGSESEICKILDDELVSGKISSAERRLVNSQAVLVRLTDLDNHGKLNMCMEVVSSQLEVLLMV